jgi:peptidoglycan/xylan/chitin deacetylase (PgdA/CDA1 family)
MICLTFDIEEFDNPFPCTQLLNFEQQMEISRKGTAQILDLLAIYRIKATFFCTANFALHAQKLIKRMVEEGHEIASHGYYHNRFETNHLEESRKALEDLSGESVTGFRMPNMREVSALALTNAGYSYSSSLNPTFLPGKYNNFRKPRSVFREGMIYQIPASVSPLVRIPLFWLALHNFPLPIYIYLAKQTLKKDGYLNLYFHPWEFVKLSDPASRLPVYVTRNSGDAMVQRLGHFISYFKKNGVAFGCLNQCISQFAGKID